MDADPSSLAKLQFEAAQKAVAKLEKSGPIAVGEKVFRVDKRG